ncbi:NTP transferase domain-containing protein, partial [Nonomuraea sp. NPDC055795]
FWPSAGVVSGGVRVEVRRSQRRIVPSRLPPDAAAVVVALVDQPFVSPAAVAALIASGGEVAVATYGGARRNPVLFGRDHFAEVAGLAVGDVGARPFLKAYPELITDVPCDGLGSPADIDTPEDLELLKGL